MPVRSRGQLILAERSAERSAERGAERGGRERSHCVGAEERQFCPGKEATSSRCYTPLPSAGTGDGRVAEPILVDRGSERGSERGGRVEADGNRAAAARVNPCEV